MWGKRHAWSCGAGWLRRRELQFDIEEVFVVGERAVIRWRLRWGEGESNSVRGVNVMRVRDGLIVEALGYSKGA